MGYKVNLNLYGYVNDDPLDGTDPTGMVIEIIGDDRYKQQVQATLDKMSEHDEGKALVDAIRNDSHTVTFAMPDRGDGNSTTFGSDGLVRPDGRPGAGTDAAIKFDPNNKTGGVDDKGSNQRPPVVGAAHEMGHAWQAIHGTAAPVKDGDYTHPKPGTTPVAEGGAVAEEGMVRQEQGQTPRTTYYPKDDPQ